MADLDAYPPYGQLLESSVDWIDDMTVDRAVSGDVRGRAFYTHKRRAFSVVHALPIADYEAFEAFYDANRTNRVTLTWCQTGLPYVCIFDGPPGKPSYPSPDVARFTVKLAEQ